LAKLTAQLETLKGKGAAVGIDFENLAASQVKIDLAFATALPAYRRSILRSSSTQCGSGKRRSQPNKQPQREPQMRQRSRSSRAAAESSAMAERFTQTMKQEAVAAGEAGKQHGALTQSFGLFRAEAGKTLSIFSELKGMLSTDSAVRRLLWRDRGAQKRF